MQFRATVTNEEINELELDQYNGVVHVITKEYELNEVFRQINAHETVGFDTETKPVFVKGHYNHVSLVQLAIPEAVYLIRVNELGLPDQLCELFSNAEIKKLGVALADDIKDLQKLRDFTPHGFVEFSNLVDDLGIESNGLRKLTATILGFRISKNAQVSNWEAPEFTEKQIRYAATDAWVALEMYNKLKGLNLI